MSQKERAAKYYAKHRARVIARSKLWRDTNKERYLELKGAPKRMFILYKNNAQRRKISFQLSFEEVTKIIAEPCYYCGEMPKYSNGIDRKDSNVGYQMDNSVACCSPCNFMKSTSSVEAFLKKCDEIVKHQKRMKLPQNKNGTNNNDAS